jgi:Alpha/beta hydrolase domain
MLTNISELSRRSALVAVTVAAALMAWAPPTQARVTRIIVDTKVSPAFNGEVFGAAGQYETIAGRVFGELDPHDPNNTIINDIDLAPRNANGKVEYMATFFLVKPIDMSKASGLLWQDVPNRGGRITISADLRRNGDVGLSSGWQGDNSGETAHQPAPGNTNDYAVVPIAKNPDGSSIIGPVMGRILNASGPDSSPIIEHSNPIPYKPITLDTSQAHLESHDHETIDGIVTGVTVIPSSDWAWASCSAANPFPGTPDPTRICLKNGFAPNKVHQVVFIAKDPYVLGVGAAAFRDAASFFRYETQDDFGTPNPLANQISWVITRGSSQSGTFVRQLIHMGMTQDEAKRKVYDGAWPIIAGRRIALNFRFAKPDLVLKLYEPGNEGPLWWHSHPDKARNLPTRGMLDRCLQTNSCPKIIEHAGAAEVWGQKLTVGWLGTDPKSYIPLPENVRRYYFASSPHGGGAGGFNVNPGNIPNCSSNNYGPGTFSSNPLPQTQTVNALRFHFRNWVMKDVPPPDSVYPRIHDMVRPSKRAMGFPEIPAVLASANPDAPNDFIQAMLDYDWGPGLDYSDNKGFHLFEPPIIKQVIPLRVPRVDEDGNELGGVPVVLLQAPLGTYLGWNVTASGFHKGKVCNYQGGWIPFAKTRAERLANGDLRLSLEERYGNHAGYVAAVKAAAANALARGFLLQEDADALIAQAEASNVLNP